MLICKRNQIKSKMSKQTEKIEKSFKHYTRFVEDLGFWGALMYLKCNLQTAFFPYFVWSHFLLILGFAHHTYLKIGVVYSLGSSCCQKYLAEYPTSFALARKLKFK